MNHLLQSRMRLLEDTIPSADRRRTHRGRLRTCRQLGEHIGRVRQLFTMATDESERSVVQEFIERLEERRAEIAAEGAVAKTAREDRAARRLERAMKIAGLRQSFGINGKEPASDEARSACNPS